MSFFIKRAIDVMVAGTGLLVLAPVLAAVAVAVRLSMGGPVLFLQVRPGIGGKPFVLRKFRTMTYELDGAGNLLPDDRRLTLLGRVLRKTSLDEIPELFNVLLGNMSLVGPRPLLLEHVPLFTPQQRRRLEVKPGITGWAQINGRNNIPFSKRIELDIWYIDHMSLGLDLKILLLTVPKTLLSRGVNLTESDDEVVDIGIQLGRDSERI